MRDSRRCHAVSAVSDKEETRTEYGRHPVSDADEIRLAEPEATVRYRRLLRASLAPGAVNPSAAIVWEHAASELLLFPGGPRYGSNPAWCR